VAGPIDPGRVAAVLAGLAAAALVAVTAYLFFSAASRNAALDRLERFGVPVRATVTGCEGIGDGVGMGTQYYDCYGTWTLAGRSYQGLVHGSRTLRPAGQTLDALAVPGDPASLTVAGSASRARQSYTAAWVLLALSGVWVAGAGAWWRRRRAAPAAEGSGADGPAPTGTR
jgi:hypothetical protein